MHSRRTNPSYDRSDLTETVCSKDPMRKQRIDLNYRITSKNVDAIRISDLPEKVLIRST